MSLAVILTLVSGGALMVIIPAVVRVLVVVVAWGCRDETAALLTRVTSRDGAVARSRT